jgi:undecaprenyl-diphosphatase
MVLTTVVVYAIKFAVKLQRPTGGLISESGYSFASGHAAFAMMFFLLSFYAYKVHIKSLFVRKMFLLINIFAALCVGISRVYLGVHYMTDVLAGFFLGITIFALSVLILDSYERAPGVVNSGK